MFVITKPQARVIAGTAAALALTGGGVVVATQGHSAPAAHAAVRGVPAVDQSVIEVLVFVSGAVEHPGLYRLARDARVADAIAAAGGLTDAADPGRLPDLAAKVRDGRQVNVPFRRTAGTRTAAAKIDINTASLDELRAIPGMPLGLPEAIVEARDAWGGFASLTELRTALGVDPAVVQLLRKYLVVAVSP